MIDKNTSIGQLISQNPNAADLLMGYGIQCYGNTENQLSSLEDISIRYGLDVDSIVSQFNNGANNLY